MLIFARPILAPGNDITDTSYRYGSTQEGQRDPHHGVEFLNAYGTPVYAAAPGVVRVAGDDRTMIYGPYPNFYGNLVIIQHDLKALIDGTHPMRLDGFDLTQPVFTLYAHLSQVLVKPGAQVKAGQLVGQVGMTGNATGPHLHFEVRLGDNAYANSRNPELWLKPHLNEQQQPKGALAGRIVSALEPFPKIEQIVIEHVPDPQGRKDWEIYLSSYVEKTLVYQPPWQENFGVGDLPAGWYRITFAYLGLQQSLVQVLPGQLTVVNFKLGEQ